LKSKKIKKILRFAKESVLRIIVGNKIDLQNKRQVTEEEGKKLGNFKRY
jgi:GTPase SAR1 family protein